MSGHAAARLVTATPMRTCLWVPGSNRSSTPAVYTARSAVIVQLSRLNSVSIRLEQYQRQAKVFRCLRHCCIVSSSAGKSVRSSRKSTEEWSSPLESTAGVPPIVALGKFDALHKGHRSLAAQAAGLGGCPWLLSFTGMAEILGWPQRPPLVPECDRTRVLQSWAPHCANFVPKLRSLPFGEVRSMSPEEFVDLLVGKLQVAGIVVGKGYRFGFKQSGDSDLLKELGKRAGIKVIVSDLVGAATPGLVGKVSSSEVRRALLLGKLTRVHDYLGRRHRLIARPVEMHFADGSLRLPHEDFLNQLPGVRKYSGDILLEHNKGAGWRGAPVLENATVGVEDSFVTLSHPGIRQAVQNADEGLSLAIDLTNSLPLSQ